MFKRLLENKNKKTLKSNKSHNHILVDSLDMDHFYIPERSSDSSRHVRHRHRDPVREALGIKSFKQLSYSGIKSSETLG